MAPVQRDEAAGKTLLPQCTHVALGRVEGMGVHTPRTQGLQHAAAGHERHLALGGRAAHKHGHLAQCSPLGHII